MNAATAAVNRFKTLRYEVNEESSAAIITLARPGRNNAFTTQMCLEVLDALDLAEANDVVRSIIVTGEGKHFCAGADLEEGFVVDDEAPDAVGAQYLARAGRVDGIPRDGGGVVALRLAQSTRPLIAAVNGAAVGVGATMTLPMDIRIVGESARFGFVFARRGLVPEAASSWFLPRMVGISRAMEWVATGRLVGAEEAMDSGLATHRVPDADLLDTALELAREIAENTAPVAVAMARHMMWGMLGAASPWEAHRLDSRAIHHLVGGPDVAEGVASFLAKRAPRFPLSATSDFPDFIPRWADRPDDIE